MLLAADLRADWLSHIVFESPGWAIICLAVVWAFMRFAGRRRDNKWMQHGSWLPFVLMLALWASSALVTTKREQLIQTVQEMLLSVEDQDTATFRALVAEDAQALFPPGNNAPRFTRDQVEERLSDFDIDDIMLMAMQSAMIGENDAVTVIRIRIDADYAGFGGIQIHTWEIVWRFEDGVWRATRLECTEAGFNPLGGGE